MSDILSPDTPREIAARDSETNVIDRSLNRLFYRSRRDRPPLRVGLLVSCHELPDYYSHVIQDLLDSTFVELSCFLVRRPLRARNTAPVFLRMDGTLAGRPESSLVFRLFQRTLDRRHEKGPDPIAPVDCSNLLSGVPQFDLGVAGRSNIFEPEPSRVEKIRGTKLDVMLNFSGCHVAGPILSAPRYGTWAFHHGDSERYTDGPAYLLELIERNPVSRVELHSRGEAPETDLVLCESFVSTDPGMSQVANRYAPYWTGTHFVIRTLRELHGYGWNHVQERSRGAEMSRGRGRAGRSPGNLFMANWIALELSRRLARRIRRRRPELDWRIAVRRSSEPLYRNPSLSTLDSFKWLDNPSGRFRADPFLVERHGQAWLFFEDFDHSTSKGAICCASLDPGGELGDVRQVMAPHHHLSYPHVFEHDGQVFMIPEAEATGRVDLYVAKTFPDNWVYEKTLLNLRAVDATVFQHGGSWWMFASPMILPGHAPITLLFQADSLFGDWTLHPSNPACSDVRLSRSAGAVLKDGGRLLRPSQDCGKGYGRALVFNEIVAIGPDQYSERPIRTIEPGWLPHQTGVHTYNRAGEWEVIDGKFDRTGLKL